MCNIMSLSQLVEDLSPKQMVVGSSPTGHV